MTLIFWTSTGLWFSSMSFDLGLSDVSFGLDSIDAHAGAFSGHHIRRHLLSVCHLTGDVNFDHAVKDFATLRESFF